MKKDEFPFREITQEDVGRSVFKAYGKTWNTADFIGRIASLDVGKRVFLREGVLRVETNNQRDARLLCEPPADPKPSTEHSYTILLPVSGEDFGKWLEDNNATIEISCQLGTYHVCINRHRLDGYKDTGSISVTRSGDVGVSSCDKVFEAALFNAMKNCDREPVR